LEEKWKRGREKNRHNKLEFLWEKKSRDRREKSKRNFLIFCGIMEFLGIPMVQSSWFWGKISLSLCLRRRRVVLKEGQSSGSVSSSFFFEVFRVDLGVGDWETKLRSISLPICFFSSSSLVILHEW
jgi:hypothetical protein